MAIFNNPRQTAGTATSSAPLARGFHTPVDATSGAKTMTLPTNAPIGGEISVEKVDSSANAVTISGTLRGLLSSIPLTAQYDARTFLSEGSGSWRPTSDHRTKTSLDRAYSGAGVSPLQFGGVGDGVANDAAAVQSALSASIATGTPLFIPAGTWLIDPLVISQVANFRLTCVGRLKRKNGSAASPLVTFDRTSGRVDSLHTDGNSANNQTGTSGVDEAKHDIKILSCDDLHFGLITSRNPAGDAVYVGGSGFTSSAITIDTLDARGSNTGRNALSIIAGTSIKVGVLRSIGVGTTAMPGGFDIETNLSSDLVNDVYVGEAYIENVGTSGFSAISTTGKTITGFRWGKVLLVRKTGAAAASAGFYLRGVDGAAGDITVVGEGVGSCASIDNADNVDVRMSLTNSGGNALTLGVNAPVGKSRLRGSVRGSAGHLVQLYQLADGNVIDLDLKDAGASSTYFALTATCTITGRNVLRGDWSKGTTGLRCFGGGGSSGTISVDTLLDGVNFKGWPVGNRRTGGTDINVIRTHDCPGFNEGASTPSFDQYEIGCLIVNNAPTAGGVVGWTATTAGVPTTATWQRTGIIGNDDAATTAQLADATAAINTTGKFQGKRVRNTTTNRWLQAGGAGTTSVWQDMVGVTAHTPA